MATKIQTNAVSRPVRAVELAENSTMRLPRGRPAIVVRVERGTVLVTRRGDLDDHVLEPGDEIVLEGEGLAVAWAFTAAAISVREAPNGFKSRNAARLGDEDSPATAHVA